MKIIFLIAFLPLINGFRYSFTCLLLGNTGCRMKCSIKCLLLDCQSEDSYCDGWTRCECNEVYNVGDMHLTVDEFENVEFVDLWNNMFEKGIASTDVRRRIQKSKMAENYTLELLRNPFVTGDDIISLLTAKYPQWKNVNSLRSRQHTLKTKVTEPGKPIQYGDLYAHYDELVELVNNVPLDGLQNTEYHRRLKKLLMKITKVEDLEEVLNLVQLTGNDALYTWVKSVLREQGYGFKEDGDSPQGKKAILQSMFTDIDEANEDEILDLTVANKFISKASDADAAVPSSANRIRNDATPATSVNQVHVNATPKVNVDQTRRDQPKNDQILEELMLLLDSIPADDATNPKYRRQLKQFFKNITNVADLEEAVYLIALTANDDLYMMIKSTLRKQGYGFEEDGDTLGNGKIAILKTIPANVIQNIGGNLPTAPSHQSITSADSKVIHETNQGNAQTIANSSSTMNSGGTAHSSPYHNELVQQNTKGGTLYYMVVDENGRVIQASGVPKKPISFITSPAPYNF